MYKIALAKPVQKFLKKHPHVFQRFFRATETLSKNPYDGTMDIKKMENKNDLRRLRIGKYRFIYEIKQDILLIYFVNA